jgi:hypothetical protein
LNKRRAVELQQVIHRLTPYKASIGWFKEPEQGWFVFGEIPAAVPTTQGNTELLTKMVRLGLEHGCEIRWWTPKRPGNPGAV